MSGAKEKKKARILEVETERRSFVVADDGYYVYWPQVLNVPEEDTRQPKN